MLSFLPRLFPKLREERIEIIFIGGGAGKGVLKGGEDFAEGARGAQFFFDNLAGIGGGIFANGSGAAAEKFLDFGR